MAYPKKLLHKWQQGGKKKTDVFKLEWEIVFKLEWEMFAEDSINKYYNKVKNKNKHMEITATDSFTINNVSYPFTKQGCADCFMAYLKQEIVSKDYEAYVISFAEWLKVNKPELFTPTTSSSSFNYNKVSLPTIPDVDPRTQKAKGIKFIAKNSGGFDTVPFEVLTGTDRDKTAVERFMSTYNTVFARPCPETPRHGFVDSRKVDSIDGVFALYDEVKKVDSNGEMVIMKPIEATKNCIITENSITIGPGHDGATTGRQAQVFPIFGTWKDQFGDISAAGISEDNVPYLETVTAADKSHYLVQMRGGPAITSRAVDYVPQQRVVKNVIKAEGDLLEWESLMVEAGKDSGNVVDHVGGALTSHFGVHAILNGVPVLTSRSPVVGETLEVVDDTVTKDYMAVVSGILNSLKTPYDAKAGARSRVTAMIYATQYFSALGGEQSYFIGHAVGTMLNLGIAACGGEYRHHPNNPFKSKYSRNGVYVKATRNFIKARKSLGKWAKSFAIDDWPGSYGGMKWYDCADAVIQLDTATRAFLRTPNDHTFGKMMMAQNRAINCAHNGGWWFNKFINQSTFDGINSESLPYVLTAVTYLYGVARPALNVDTLDMYQKYSNAKNINVKIERVEIPLEPVFAQVRIIERTMVDTFITSADSLTQGVMLRTQIRWDANSEHFAEENHKVDNVAEFWDFSAEPNKSLASGLVAYVPMTWAKNGDNWDFFLASNGQKVISVPLKYEFKAIEA